jgi:hypothetical protein
VFIALFNALVALLIVDVKAAIPEPVPQPVDILWMALASTEALFALVAIFNI